MSRKEAPAFRRPVYHSRTTVNAVLCTLNVCCTVPCKPAMQLHARGLLQDDSHPAAIRNLVSHAKRTGHNKPTPEEISPGKAGLGSTSI